MKLDEEKATEITEALEAKGFRNTIDEHRWNFVSRERSFENGLSLLVWGRLDQPDVCLQISYPDSYDGCVTLLKTLDVPKLIAAVEVATNLLNYLVELRARG